jgi:rSAM/selenodomain-associated transferase 1
VIEWESITVGRLARSAASHLPGSDGPQTIIVLAKQPRPGRVKTRLQSRFSPEEASELAAAALTDTLRAVRRSAAPRRVLAWDGDPFGWDAGFDVVQQPDGDLGTRLAAAFAAAMAEAPGAPVLLIGMDTPQVPTALLDRPWHGADAVLGLSEDGGFWAIGLRSVDPYAVFAGIPMSTDRTAAAQLARLSALGLSVELLPPLRDVDEPADAEWVADHHPQLAFAERHTELVARRQRQSVDRLFDELYAGRPVRSRTSPVAAGGVGSGAAGPTTAGPSTEEFVDGRHRWLRPADPVDAMVVSRCEPPVIDIGCGPGRMVAALQRSGRAVLGIDISKSAVEIGVREGGQILRRDLVDQLPGEGRWGTALLLDGNVGIGGDVPALLLRCRDLVGPGGLIICETDPDPDRDDRYDLVLTDAQRCSEPMAWVSLGIRSLQGIAATLDLILVEEWQAGGRAFVSLRTAS